MLLPLAQSLPTPWDNLLSQSPLVAMLIGFLWLFLSRRLVTRKEMEEAVTRERERGDEWKLLARGGTQVAGKAASSLEGLTTLLEKRIEEVVASEVASMKRDG